MMHARATILSTEPARADALMSFLRDQVLPQARTWDGFKGFIGLIDRSTGKSLSVSIWESEEAMKASEESAGGLRSAAAESVGAAAPVTERYEVAVFEV